MKDTCWLYGKHPVLLALKNKQREIYSLLITKKNYNELLSKEILQIIKSRRINPVICDNGNITNKVGKDINHQGVALNVKASFSDLDDIDDNVRKIIILDQVTDIGNLGAIIRSSVAFNIKNIIIPKHNIADDYGKIAKASAGLIEHINLIQVTNLVSALNFLKEKEFWSIGLDGEAYDDITAIKKFNKIALIMGSEGKGIRPLIKKNCDMLVKIPISSDAESLNVASAAAIACYIAK